MASSAIASLAYRGQDAAPDNDACWPTAEAADPERTEAAGAFSFAGYGAGYGASRPRPLVLAVVIAMHALALTVLLTHKIILEQKAPPEAMLVVDLPRLAPTPPQTAIVPEVQMEIPEILVPPPMIEVASETRPTVTARLAEPVAAAVRAPGNPGTVSIPTVGSTLEALPPTMIEAVPPRYPFESRQRKEQGTVVLDVRLAPSGRVEQIAIHTSSGSPRLDKAALDAVRRWRWSPMLRDGVAVAVHGLVEIPFVLSRR